MRPNDPGETEEERRRRRREKREDAGDAVDGAADVVEAASGFGVPTGCGGRGGGGRSGGGGRDGGSDGWGCGGGSGGGRGGGSGCGSGGGGGRGGGGCDGCDCNLSLLSTLLLLAAAVLPDPGTGSLVRGLIHLYRRLLTRFTPRCPSTPSCSAYALTAVRTLGTRRGLAAAAQRVRRCGT